MYLIKLNIGSFRQINLNEKNYIWEFLKIKSKKNIYC